MNGYIQYYCLAILTMQSTRVLQSLKQDVQVDVQ